MNINSMIINILSVSLVSIGCGADDTNKTPEKKRPIFNTIKSLADLKNAGTRKKNITIKPNISKTTMNLTDPESAVNSAKYIVKQRHSLAEALVTKQEYQENEIADATKTVNELRSQIDADLGIVALKNQLARADSAAANQKKKTNSIAKKTEALAKNLTTLGKKKSFALSLLKVQLESRKKAAKKSAAELQKLEKKAEIDRTNYFSKLESTTRENNELTQAVANLEILKKEGEFELELLKTETEKKMDLLNNIDLKIQLIYGIKAEELSVMNSRTLRPLD